MLRNLIFILIGILYYLSPLDLLPDFLFGIPGKIDDLLVLGLMLWAVATGKPIWRFFRTGRTEQARGGDSKASHEGEEDETKTSSGMKDEKDPYRILGLSKDATIDEIKSAYRGGVQKYHPDRVAHLGKEFQDLAHKRFILIQRAYEELIRRKGQ